MTSLFSRVWDWSNLLIAAQRAAAGKRGHAAAARFEYDLAGNLLALQRTIREGTYRPGPYANFHIAEPKRRLISAAPFRDRVVHHAVCQVIEPLFERRFIDHSYANRLGKGTHRAVDRCQDLARQHRYVLPCDIRQHFASIDHAVLRSILGATIQDASLLRLCDQIISSGEGVLSEKYDMVYFPGDDLWAASRPRGLPIGNLTSQFWSNCFLDPFDHFVTRELRCGAYLRYVDDFLLFSDDKAALWHWRAAIVERLAKLRLTIHEDRAKVQRVTQGIPWLGFVVYPNHRRVKRRNVVNYRRRLGRLYDAYQAGHISFAELDASVQGWINHVRYGDTHALRKAVLRPIVIKGPRFNK